MKQLISKFQNQIYSVAHFDMDFYFNNIKMYTIKNHQGYYFILGTGDTPVNKTKTMPSGSLSSNGGVKVNKKTSDIICDR